MPKDLEANLEKCAVCYSRYKAETCQSDDPELFHYASQIGQSQNHDPAKYKVPYFPEQIPIADQKDLVGTVFQDRMGLVKSKIELILEQLSQRKQISYQVLRQIEQDSCYVQSLIFALGIRQYDMGRDRLTLERMKMDLEKQRRMEHVSYFRDTGFLARDLREALIEYLDETHKGRLINDMEV